MTKAEAIEMLNKWGVLLPSEASEALDMAIEALQDEAEPGEWIERVASGDFGSHWYEYECSVCGNVQARLTNCCSNCGAKMTKGGDE